MKLIAFDESPNTLRALVLDNYTIFFSYQTPVAAFRHSDSALFVDKTHYSVTTSKHLNIVRQNYSWIHEEPVDPSFFELTKLT